MVNVIADTIGAKYDKNVIFGFSALTCFFVDFFIFIIIILSLFLIGCKIAFDNFDIL